MTDIFWDHESSILVVAADRSLGSVLHRLDEEDPDWVVVVRTLPGSPEVYYYAYRSAELRQLAQDFPERLTWSVEDAMGLHEWMSSSTARGGRFTGEAQGQDESGRPGGELRCRRPDYRHWRTRGDDSSCRRQEAPVQVR